ncbi:MAG: SH3 domain-containing protein [Lachnospiraceae bacterium]|nr:SH3 domain-containing protein [Lachnospiraceae bacterium]
MRRVKDLRWKLFGYVSAVVMMVVIFAMSAMNVWAAEGKVTASAAKIRKDASTSSEAVGSATNGQTFTIVGEKTGGDGKVWYQITFDGDKTGYIRSDLMKKTEDTGNTGNDGNSGTTVPTAQVENLQPVSASIVGNTVRVRSDATTEGSTIVANVVKDSVVTITGRATDSQNKIWYLVSFSSDSGEVKGFIREDFLSVSGTITPVVDTPPAEEQPPVEDEPVVDNPTTNPPVITDKYYVQEDEGAWYLVDKDAGLRYNAESLINAAINNPEVFAENQKKIKSQKTWIVILVILVAALGIVATLLFLKVREVMDDAYFAAIEKETIRQRQGQKANNPSGANRNQSVMHTVGANGNKTGSAQKSGGPKPANTRLAGQQQRPTGNGVPQTVKVSDPAETRTAKTTATQQRSANPQSKPVNGVDNAQAKPSVQSTKPVQQKPVESPNKQQWQSKNFATDEDDEFEFEFLNWDGTDEE